MEIMGSAMHPENLLRWRELVNIGKDPERPYISGTTVLDAYWRTLFMNVDPQGDSKNSHKTADSKTRALHDDWWWKILLRVNYGDVPDVKSDIPESAFEQVSTHVAMAISGRKIFIF